CPITPSSTWSSPFCLDVPSERPRRRPPTSPLVAGGDCRGSQVTPGGIRPGRREISQADSRQSRFAQPRRDFPCLPCSPGERVLASSAAPSPRRSGDHVTSIHDRSIWILKL